MPGLFQDDPGAMRLYSRKKINPLEAVPSDINPLDIGRALSRQCRYNGHVGGYLSVARHSLWVAHRLNYLYGDDRLTLCGLLHDAAETYLGDLIRPIKYGKMGEEYLLAEARLEGVVAERFNLPHPFPPEVHEADNWVLLNKELGGPEARWTWDSTPDQDEQAWLARYFILEGTLNA